MTIRIIGSGMAGLLAANMLRKYKPVIYEAKGSLPNNHGALLRFRSSSVSDATCIDFKKVKVIKNIYDNERLFTESTIKLSNKYSKRVTGELHNRSICNLDSVYRYIAPDDFIEKCAQDVEINFNNPFSHESTSIFEKDIPTISTIPMPSLMDALNYPEFDESKFKFRGIKSFRYKIKMNCDLYQTIYIPDNYEYPFYRISITGNILICESSYDSLVFGTDEIISSVLEKIFGITENVKLEDVEIVKQKYGKLIPINKNYARRFITWATNKHNIYSLGRFSTWRQLLMDDCVNDVKVIEKLIKTENYER